MIFIFPPRKNKLRHAFYFSPRKKNNIVYNIKMNPIKRQNLIEGEHCENRLHATFNQVFGKLKRTPMMDCFDYSNKRFMIELKCRPRININSYPSLIFNQCKLIDGFRHIREGKRVIFIWALRDNLWWWEMNTRNSCEYELGLNIRADRGKVEQSNVVKVHIRFLKPLEQFNTKPMTTQ